MKNFIIALISGGLRRLPPSGVIASSLHGTILILLSLLTFPTIGVLLCAKLL